MAAVGIHGGQHVAFDANGAWMCGTGRHDRKDLVDGASGIVVAHAGDVAPGHLPCGCIRVRVLGIARGGDVRGIPPGCRVTARSNDSRVNRTQPSRTVLRERSPFGAVKPHMALLREKIEVIAAVGAKMAAIAATAADGSPA